jgi:hypothetical protein
MTRAKLLESIGMDTHDDVDVTVGNSGGLLGASLMSGGLGMPCDLGAGGAGLRDGPAALQGRDASCLHSNKKSEIDDHNMMMLLAKSMPSALAPTTRGLHVNHLDISSLPEAALDEEWNDDHYKSSRPTTMATARGSKAVSWHSTAGRRPPSGRASNKPCSAIEESIMEDDLTMPSERPAVFFHSTDVHAVENCGSIWESGVRLNSDTSAKDAACVPHGGAFVSRDGNHQAAGMPWQGEEASSASALSSFSSPPRHAEAASQSTATTHPHDMQGQWQVLSPSVPVHACATSWQDPSMLQHQQQQQQQQQGGVPASTMGAQTVTGHADDALRSHRKRVARLLRKGRSVMM